MMRREREKKLFSLKYVFFLIVFVTVTFISSQTNIVEVVSMTPVEEQKTKATTAATTDNKVKRTVHQVRKELLQKGIEPIVPGPSLESYESSNNDIDMNEAVIDHGLDSQWKYELYSRLDRVQLMCGNLCQLNSLEEIEKHTIPNKNKNDEGEEIEGILPTVVIPNVECDAILANEDIDAGDMTFPPLIPDELMKFYNLSGAFSIRQGKDKVRKDAYLEGEAEKSLWPTGNIWNEGDIDNAVQMVGNNTLAGPYGLEETIELTKSLSHMDIEDKSVLVIGSSHPWVEAICLYHKARKVTTLEYGEIISNHPKIETETPSTMRKKYIDGNLDFFDVVVTQSSVEHSGLGRYGDALNPWGDILAIARAWCVTKKEGQLWIGVPTGLDRIFYNWHRIFGRIRWPLLAANWRQVGPQEDFAYYNGSNGVLNRGIWISMQSFGFMFEKIDPEDYVDQLSQ